jgi:hypothetical protein
VAPCEKYPDLISRPTQHFQQKNNQSLRGGRLPFGSAGILHKKKESDRWLSSVGFHEKYRRPPTHHPTAPPTGLIRWENVIINGFQLKVCEARLMVRSYVNPHLPPVPAIADGQ